MVSLEEFGKKKNKILGNMEETERKLMTALQNKENIDKQLNSIISKRWKVRNEKEGKYLTLMADRDKTVRWLKEAEDKF